jgi:hypothetical protein
MSTPPGMKVNTHGIAGEGVQFNLINETDRGIIVTLFLVPVPPTPQLDGETWPSFTVLPTSMPYSSDDGGPNLAQFLYPAPRGVYNAFVQVDGGLYEVGADVSVSATGSGIANPLYAGAHADVMR